MIYPVRNLPPQRRKISIYRTASISNIWLVFITIFYFKVLKHFTCDQQEKKCCHFNGMFCEEQFLLTSLHFRGSARTTRLAQTETVQLLTQTLRAYRVLKINDAIIFAFVKRQPKSKLNKCWKCILQHYFKVFFSSFIYPVLEI